MRLNGWQRIGAVLSVLWIVAGGLWMRSVLIQEMGDFATKQLSLCLAMHSAQPDGSVTDTDWGPCNREFEANWKLDVTQGGLNAFNAAFTFIPLLLTWLFVYAIVGLTRWIRAGFAA
jgi:hypothetical protein